MKKKVFRELYNKVEKPEVKVEVPEVKEVKEVKEKKTKRRILEIND